MGISSPAKETRAHAVAFSMCCGNEDQEPRQDLIQVVGVCVRGHFWCVCVGECVCVCVIRSSVIHYKATSRRDKEAEEDTEQDLSSAQVKTQSSVHLFAHLDTKGHFPPTPSDLSQSIFFIVLSPEKTHDLSWSGAPDRVQRAQTHKEYFDPIWTKPKGSKPLARNQLATHISLLYSLPSEGLSN